MEHAPVHWGIVELAAVVMGPLAALFEPGNTFIREFTQEKYRAMIGEWKSAIEQYLLHARRG